VEISFARETQDPPSIFHLLLTVGDFGGSAANSSPQLKNESIQTAVNPASNSRLLSRKITIG